MKTGIAFTFVLLAGATLASAGGSETALEMANRGAQFYMHADYPQAETLYRRALAAWPDGPDGARGKGILQGSLGELLRVTGRYGEAQSVLLNAFQGLEAVGAPAKADIGRVLDDLSVLYRAQGNLVDAELSAVRAAPLVDETEKPANRLALASVYIEQKRFAEAEPVLLEVAASPDQRVSLTAHLCLAVAALAQDHFGQADASARRALELAERVLPKNHPAIATALNDLAAACRFSGQYLEAEKRYREAIAIWEDSLGPDHPELAKGLLGLAGLYHERERESGAESLYQRAIQILDRAMGKNDPQVLLARTELADVFRAERRYTEADKLSRATMAAMEKTFGTKDPRFVHALTYYARLLSETNRKAEAAAILKRIEPEPRVTTAIAPQTPSDSHR